MIRESGICKCESRKIHQDWAKDEKNGDNDTRFEQFKVYYIKEKASLAADEVQGITNRANNVMEQKITNL